MNRHALIVLLLGSMLWTPVGCATRRKEPVAIPIPANGFVKKWGVTLDLRKNRDEADRLFLRGDLVFLYTKQNRVYTFSAASGEFFGSYQPASPQSSIRPPVLLGDKIVIPTITTLEVYDRKGRRIESLELDRPTRSPAVVQNNVLYIGTDYPRGGRLIKLDITQPYGRLLWEMMTFGAISAAPAIVEDGIYLGSEDGGVYAFTSSREPIWAIDGNVFRTAGPIKADLKGDEFGIYVASTDSKLYCLDPSTGRIKWTYSSLLPLFDAPVATDDRVYQVVPGRGIVAINKLEGQMNRIPVWTAPAAKQVLATDQGHVYVLATDRAITALNKQDGQPRFRSRRRDLVLGTVNPSGDTIYTATRRGEILAVQPVLQSGVVGEVVQLPESPPLASAAQNPRNSH